MILGDTGSIEKEIQMTRLKFYYDDNLYLAIVLFKYYGRA